MTEFTFAVRYIDLINGIESVETMRPLELHFWLDDDTNGEIRILEIDHTTDGWETMEVLYRAS